MTRTDAQAARERCKKLQACYIVRGADHIAALDMLQRAMKEIEGLDRAMECGGSVYPAERKALLREWGSAPQ